MMGGNGGGGTGIRGAGVRGGTVPAGGGWGPTLPSVLGGPVYVSSGVTLTVPPLAVVKAAASVFMVVQGTLNADGAGGAVQFPSLKDDTGGGDTNGGGGATSPGAGGWGASTLGPPGTR